MQCVHRQARLLEYRCFSVGIYTVFTIRKCIQLYCFALKVKNIDVPVSVVTLRLLSEIGGLVRPHPLPSIATNRAAFIVPITCLRITAPFCKLDFTFTNQYEPSFQLGSCGKVLRQGTAYQLPGST